MDLNGLLKVFILFYFAVCCIDDHCDDKTSHVSVARPSLSHSSDIESTSTGRHSGLLPKFAISAEAESCESSLSLDKASKVTFSVGELPQDEPDATTPSSPVSNATLSGTAFVAKQIYFLLF